MKGLCIYSKQDISLSDENQKPNCCPLGAHHGSNVVQSPDDCYAGYSMCKSGDVGHGEGGSIDMYVQASYARVVQWDEEWMWVDALDL